MNPEPRNRHIRPEDGTLVRAAASIPKKIMAPWEVRGFRVVRYSNNDWPSNGVAPPREGLPHCVLGYLSFDDRHASLHDAHLCPGDDRDAIVPLTRYTVRAGVGVRRPVPNHPHSHGLFEPLQLDVHSDDIEEANAAWARAEDYVKERLAIRARLERMAAELGRLGQV